MKDQTIRAYTTLQKEATEYVNRSINYKFSILHGSGGLTDSEIYAMLDAGQRFDEASSDIEPGYFLIQEESRLRGTAEQFCSELRRTIQR